MPGIAASQAIPADERAGGRARRFVERELDGVVRRQALERLRLAVTEMVYLALAGGRRPGRVVRVGVRLASGTTTLTVQDDAMDRGAIDSSAAERGRRILGLLSSSWGIDDDPPRVWAVIPGERRHPPEDD